MLPYEAPPTVIKGPGGISLVLDVHEFNGNSPLIKQLETLASIWGGPDVLAVALDWILENGRGGKLLPPAPVFTTETGRMSSGPQLQQLPRAARTSDEQHMHYRSWEQK